MTLLLVLLLPMAGGLLAWPLGERSPALGRAVAALALAIDLAVVIALWRQGDGGTAAAWGVDWIPQLGIRFALAMDGLSMLMVLLSCIVALATVLAMGHAARERQGLYLLLLMTLTSAIIGVFLADDLMLFFILYEVMLLPSYALLLVWGSEKRSRAATRFFIFTQASGLLMLVSILGLHLAHLNATGSHSFALGDLLGTAPTGALATLFFLGFVLAFAVKLPLIPFHTWQPDAYEAAPTEASILFSALMAKTAGYGLLRFVVPLFPESLMTYASWGMAVSVATILYASWVAYGQTDIKRIIAYSSAAHLGYVALGVFSMNDLAYAGVVLQLFCHGISVTGLFLLADVIERRTGTRDIEALGGLWQTSPRAGGVMLVFVLATLGLPGLGNFVGEFLILAGTFQASPVAGGLATFGAVLGAAYSLRLMQRVFFGERNDPAMVLAVSPRVLAVSGALITILVVLGVYPQPLLQAAGTTPESVSIAQPVEAAVEGEAR